MACKHDRDRRMIGRRCMLLMGLCLGAWWSCCFAKEVRYHEGFEGERSPVTFWTRGPYGDYRVNYAGLTDERARSGEKSFKLDITFLGNGNFNYWAGPVLDIPAVPGIRLTGYVYLERVPKNVNVGFGHSFFVPAGKIVHPKSSGRGMCGPIDQLGATSAGKWIRQDADLSVAGDSISNGVLKESTPGVCLEKWYLHIECRNAVDARLVLYLDDVSVTGTVPANWESLTKQKLVDWQVLREAGDRVSRRELEEALAPIRSECQRLVRSIPQDDILAAVPEEPWRPYAQALLNATRRKADQLLAATDPARKTMPKKPKQFVRSLRDEHLRPVEISIANLRKLRGRTDACLVFVQNNPITNYKILPTTLVMDGHLEEKVRIFASPGEYEPAAFVLLPSQDTTVTFTLPDLRCEEAAISSSCLDLRAVKVWYQAGIEVGEVNKHILTPELLLRDDELVRVDHEQKANIVRNIDAPQDAAELRPVRVPARTAKQFWLTAHVPETAPPGVYTGEIVVRAEGLGERRLAIALRVLPIKLEEPFLEYSMYYRAHIGPQEPTFVSSELKSPAQLEAELRNMKAHGIANPNVYQRPVIRSDGTVDLAFFDKYLDIKRRAGLEVDPLYFLGFSTGSGADEKESQKRLRLFRQIIDYARTEGIKEVYFYGSDEARGEALKRQRGVWKAIRGMDGKIFAACSTGFFELVGDLLDLPVIARQSPADVPRVHALGHRMHNYANPSGAIEQPYTYRYSFGLWLARSGMDGSHTYAYQHGWGAGKSMGRIWDDFDDKVYRSIAFAYPTVDGVVDTLQWEGVREAVDDVRYLTTLRKAIAEAKRAGEPKVTALAQEAEQWLDQLNIEGDLQEARRQMASRIIALRGKTD